MKTGNNVPAAHARHDVHPRDDSQRQLRDIEELVDKLRVVTKQLQFHPGSASAAAAAPGHPPVTVPPETRVSPAMRPGETSTSPAG